MTSAILLLNLEGHTISGKDMRKLSLAFTLTSFGLLAAISNGQGTMYGVSNNGNFSELYTINTATGASTAIGTLNHNASFSGLEYLNGTLYVTDLFDSSTGNFAFGSIDISTGASTIIAQNPATLNMWGLAANANLNLLYTVDRDNGNILTSITTGGVFTAIGATGISDIGAGLAFDTSTNTLYSTGFDGNLYTINTTTGAASLVGSLGLSFNNVWQGMAYDSDNDVLYLNDADTDSLYTVNRTTGLATLVGPNVNFNGLGIDGLAYAAAPVPEPASMAALGLGALALLRRRNKK